MLQAFQVVGDVGLEAVGVCHDGGEETGGAGGFAGDGDDVGAMKVSEGEAVGGVRGLAVFDQGGRDGFGEGAGGQGVVVGVVAQDEGMNRADRVDHARAGFIARAGDGEAFDGEAGEGKDHGIGIGWDFGQGGQQVGREPVVIVAEEQEAVRQGVGGKMGLQSGVGDGFGAGDGGEGGRCDGLEFDPAGEEGYCRETVPARDEVNDIRREARDIAGSGVAVGVDRQAGRMIGGEGGPVGGLAEGEDHAVRADHGEGVPKRG